jgi:hypothetical protein
LPAGRVFVGDGDLAFAQKVDQVVTSAAGEIKQKMN